MSLSGEFLENGIVKIPVESMDSLEEIRGVVLPHNEFIDQSALNRVRLQKIEALNSKDGVRILYHRMAKNALNELAGNELVMQRNINLSIQLPGDTSSLLPIHADSLQGDSDFEVVLWVPLVDCYGTKSMFFCQKEASDEARKNLHNFKTIDELYEHLKPHIYYVDVKYGEALIFHQGIFHGNTVNQTSEARWSLNCRFKSLFSPYSDKKLGEFFSPIFVRPLTQMGLSYARG